MLTYANGSYIWRGRFEDRAKPKEAGFAWSPQGRCWWTTSPYQAYLLRHEVPLGGPGKFDPVVDRLIPIHRMIQASTRTEPVLPLPAVNGNNYYPFQAAGIEHMVDLMRAGHRYLLCADEQGLGKTIQAIGVANEMGFRRLLVICPASLRLNWRREIERWHTCGAGVHAVMTGRDTYVPTGYSAVASYNLAGAVDMDPDMIIVDEVHYVKTPTAARTRAVLGDDETQGIVRRAPTIFLSGTPIPNGRPNEIWPVLFRCAPKVIDYAKIWPFISKYCLYDDYTQKVLGSKNTTELFVRLRGSGFMTRRLKKDVLKDLPDKRWKLVVFEPDSRTRKVLQKEKQFSAREIVEHGIPVGTALPEIRREMGEAKIPQVVDYVTDLLEEGVGKVVVFGHHVVVMQELARQLADYHPVMIIGGVAQGKRQEIVDRFQSDPACRVFLGNEAAEEGITLTAAQDVVLAEPEWVPGKNDQRVDRCHRIGQKGSVLVHVLVVEESLDAYIMGAALEKADSIKNILDKHNFNR